jgi:hypothetical protein
MGHSILIGDVEAFLAAQLGVDPAPGPDMSATWNL